MAFLNLSNLIVQAMELIWSLFEAPHTLAVCDDATFISLLQVPQLNIFTYFSNSMQNSSAFSV